MTTDSGVAPNPGEQTTVDPAAEAAAAQAAQQQQAEPTVDIDEQEVTAAKAAAEAEKAAGIGDGGTAPAAPGAAQQAQPQAPAGQQQPQEPIQVPKARLDEVLAQRDRLAQDAAYWRGVADAKVATTAAPQGQPGAQQPQPQQPTAEQRLAGIHTEQDTLAKKFDDGEITYSELVKQQRELTNREQTIREDMLLAKVPKAPQQPQANDDLFLDNETAKLEQAHPWVIVADKVGTAVDWKYIQDRAIENLVARGIDPTEGNRGKLALRTEVAELFDQYGPALLGAKATAKGITIPGQDAAAQQRQPMSQAAQARAAKLDLAGRAAPNLSKMTGTNGEPTGVPSEARLESMGDDEIGNLPDSMRRKLLGLT